MNKKLTKILSIFLLAGLIGTCSALAVTGCNKNENNNQNQTGGGGTEDGGEHVHDYEWTDNDDGTHTGACKATDCNVEVKNEPHIWGNDSACTKCGHEMTATDLNADDFSASPVVVDTFADETGIPAQVEEAKVPEYVGADEALTVGLVDALFEFDPAKLSTIKYTSGWTDDTFSLAANTEIRGRIKTGLYEEEECVDANYVTVNSVKLGSSAAALKLNVPAAGTLVFYVSNGSSDVVGKQTLTLTKPNGSRQAIHYLANGSSSTVQRVTIQLEDKGVYSIARASGTSDIYYAKFTTTLDESAVTGIKVANAGTTDFLVGQQLDCSDVSIVRKHQTGVIIPVSAGHIQIDASAYNPAQAGTYAIKVKYTVEGNLDSQTKEFTTTYDVTVYDYGELNVYVEHIKQGANTSADNSTYINNAFRQYYTVGETFSPEGINLGVVGKFGEKTKNFKIDGSQATISGADLSKEGVRTVKIAYTLNGITKAKGVLITVKKAPEGVSTEQEVKVAVNKDFAQVNVGTKNLYGAYRFNTIQQALEFLTSSNLGKNVPKTMYLAEGTYNEKVEVNVPNLTIIGDNANRTKIEYNALYGVEDAGGFVHTTDSTATLNVREKAVGFTIKNVTISNYFNSAGSYKNAQSNDCRALAMLIQADKVVVENCTILGYQDTLELFTGRQLFKNCKISGVTDFIFGTNNTTYFYKCEIRSINHRNEGQPGYVTAFRGNNKDTATDKVTYGAIFDDCDFTADSGVPQGKCALGRAWGTDAAVMIMNSRIGAHISKTGATSQGGRYISMGNGDPETAQFTEYNNSGDGAINQDLDTVKVLTEEQAANYKDFAVIFGKVNNLVNYDDVWDGSYGADDEGGN